MGHLMMCNNIYMTCAQYETSPIYSQNTLRLGGESQMAIRVEVLDGWRLQTG